MRCMRLLSVLGHSHRPMSLVRSIRCLDGIPSVTCSTRRCIHKPWTSRTGGEAAVGMPLGQLSTLARVVESTEKGASPSNTNEGACLFAMGLAKAGKWNERSISSTIVEGIASVGQEQSRGVKMS